MTPLSENEQKKSENEQHKTVASISQSYKRGKHVGKLTNNLPILLSGKPHQ